MFDLNGKAEKKTRSADLKLQNVSKKEGKEKKSCKGETRGIKNIPQSFASCAVPVARSRCQNRTEISLTRIRTEFKVERKSVGIVISISFFAVNVSIS
jgi:hypothetical protein